MNSKRFMPGNKSAPRAATTEGAAAKYIRTNFAPEDRLAVVLLNKRAHDAIQRSATAEKIAEPDFQAWLRFQNANRYEIYISMNALAKTAAGRTKADVE